MVGIRLKVTNSRKRWLSLSTIFIYFLFLLIIILFLNYFFKNEVQILFYDYKAIYDYIAIITDERANQSIVNAVTNVLQHIPSDWKVQIVTPYHNWPFYTNSTLAQLIHDNRVFLTPLEAERKRLSGTDFINLVLTSTAFWYQVQGDKVLLFQADSVLCSNSPYNLTDYLQYDFIGAPWSAGGCCNGGLSLRSRTKTLEMLENRRFPVKLYDEFEDGWFSRNLHRVNGRLPSREVAMTFAVETIYHPRPFAIHNPHLDRIGRKNMDKLCNECPEAKTTFAVCQSPISTHGSTISNRKIGVQ